MDSQGAFFVYLSYFIYFRKSSSQSLTPSLTGSSDRIGEIDGIFTEIKQPEFKAKGSHNGTNCESCGPINNRCYVY